MAEGQRLGYRVIYKEEFDQRGVDAVVSEVRDRVGGAPDYITFDLDVLDTTVAPGIANLLDRGLSQGEQRLKSPTPATANQAVHQSRRHSWAAGITAGPGSLAQGAAAGWPMWASRNEPIRSSMSTR